MDVEPQGSGETTARSRVGLFGKSVVVAAMVLPLAALGTCSATLGPDAAGELLGWGLALFGLSVVAGFLVLMMLLGGTSRRLTGLALGVNVAGVAANVAYFLSQFRYTRGRQLRGPKGRVLPARAAEPAAGEMRPRAARAWRNNGDTEAASVSAFALLSLDLAELGAPLALTRTAHEDALDEIRHAELCYGLARAYGDVEAGLAPLPGLAAVRGRACTLLRVAVESFVEGAYLEAVSAEIAGALRTLVAADAVRAVLDVIAADEARHADHAWTVVAWCLETDRAAVGAALGEALARVPAPDPRDDEPGSDGSLEPLGIPGRELQRSIAARCLVESKSHLTRLLAAPEQPTGSLRAP